MIIIIDIIINIYIPKVGQKNVMMTSLDSNKKLLR